MKFLNDRQAIAVKVILYFQLCVFLYYVPIYTLYAVTQTFGCLWMLYVVMILYGALLVKYYHKRTLSLFDRISVEYGSLITTSMLIVIFVLFFIISLFCFL